MAGTDFRECRVDHRAAEVFLDRVAQRARTQARMKTALHNECDELLARGEVKAFIAQERKLASDVKSRDLHLHIVAQTVEDQLLRDACLGEVTVRSADLRLHGGARVSRERDRLLRLPRSEVNPLRWLRARTDLHRLPRGAESVG